MFNLPMSTFLLFSFKRFLTEIDDVINIYRNHETFNKYVKLNFIHFTQFSLDNLE